MTPHQYLLHSVKLKSYWSLSWIASVFTVTNESDQQKKERYPGKFVREPFGAFYLDDELNPQPLDIKLDANKALFNKADVITIKQTDFPFLKEAEVETTIGRLLLNLIVVFEPFQGRLAYINKRFGPGDVENIITPSLKSVIKDGKPKEDGKFYVDEYLQFCKAVTFIENMAPLFANSITRAAMLPAPGRHEFKKTVLAKYEGKLRDPVEMAHFQSELRAFDNAYLEKNDPAFGKFTKGKISDARNKVFMTQGGESNEFIGQLDTTPIIKSLDEGIDLTPEQFVATANTIRYGSFSRGAETVNGGVVAKALMTALDTWRVVAGDCGATLGATRTYNEKKIKLLVQRSIIMNGKAVFIENLEQAKPFADKKISIRSPQYCRRPGLETCEVCAGAAIGVYKHGQVIPNLEVSAGIMNDSLKKMHNTSISSKVFTLTDIIS